MAVKIGAKIPNSGPLPQERGIAAMASELEKAGFDSLWSSDHIVMPRRVESRYHFSDDGRPTWPAEMPWFDAVVAMSMMGAATERAEIGVAVLVLPLRHPIAFAKQMASLDALTGGRLVLGVGAGWLAEEFEAIGVPFESRGSRLDEWIGLMRDCWTGAPAGRDGEHYRLPDGVLCYPTPVREPPVLVGGMTKPALRRAGRIGSGWLALQRAGRLDVSELASGVESVRASAEAAGRDPDDLGAVLRIIESAGAASDVARSLPAIRDAGITEVVVDVDWDDDTSAATTHDLLRSASV